jgi:hypothetical protein
MTFGHTDDVPNTVDSEAKPTPEASTVLHESKALGIVKLKML